MEKRGLDISSEFTNNTLKNGFANNGIYLSAKELEANQNKTVQSEMKQKEIAESPRKEFSLRLTIFGFLCGVVGSLLVATGTSCAQALQGAVPDFELAIFRGFFQMFFAACFLIFSRELPKVEKKTAIWVASYAFFMTAFNITNYLSINYIAVGTASCVRRSLSLLLITILARIILKEIITVMKVTSVAVSIVGVILIVQPWYDQSQLAATTFGALANEFSHHHHHHQNFLLQNLQDLLFGSTRFHEIYPMYEETNTTALHNSTILSTIDPGSNDNENSVEDDILGYVLALTAGASITFGSIIQKAKLQEYNTLILNFYTGWTMMIVSLILSLTTEEMTFPTEAGEIALVVGQSVCSGIAVIIITRAIGLTSPVLITVAMSLQVVFLLIAQYTVLAHIQPSIGNWVEITGAVLVVLSAFLPPGWEIIVSKLNTSNKNTSLEPNDEFVTHL